MALQLGGIEVGNEAVHHLLGELQFRLLDLGAGYRLVDLRLRADVLRQEERLEQERVALRADQAEVLGAAEDEPTDAAHAGLLHRLEQEDVGPPLRGGRRRREVIGAIEVDGIDLVEVDEARDVN